MEFFESEYYLVENVLKIQVISNLKNFENKILCSSIWYFNFLQLYLKYISSQSLTLFFYFKMHERSVFGNGSSIFCYKFMAEHIKFFLSLLLFRGPFLKFLFTPHLWKEKLKNGSFIDFTIRVFGRQRFLWWCKVKAT